jgi:hypothetical protein
MGSSVAGTVPPPGGKRSLPSNRLIEETIRVTRTQRQRLELYLAEHDGKQRADAWRDVINAGLKALGIPAVPATAAGA